MRKPDETLPWTTPPIGQGAHTCHWCFRVIYVPALSCSLQPVEGLLRMNTFVGRGARCKDELMTREAELLVGL